MNAPPTNAPPTNAPSTNAPSTHTRRALATIMIATIGLALLAAAIAATQEWFDRHIIASLFLPRRWYEWIYEGIRVVIAASGLALLLRARRIADRLQAPARTLARAVPIVLAALLALGASELALSREHRPTTWLIKDEEPRRRPDPRLGWTFEPSRVGRSDIAGRTIDYAFDANGYRVRQVDHPVDYTKPTIVFLGESVMFGEGLTWDESIPAQVGALLHRQPANLAVHGYSTDQSFLRLETELPKFHEPIAVVMLFMPALFGRNLDDDHPHVDEALTWHPATQHAHLLGLAKLLVPWRDEDTVEHGITRTTAVLRATTNLAHQRGATPLILVPQLGPEEPLEHTLRRRILEEPALPYVYVEIDKDWRLPWDRHPNAHAAHVIASAIAARLQRSPTP